MSTGPHPIAVPLVVRPVGPGDAEGLLALYERLGTEDRYRRFFSGFRPDRSFVDAEIERATTDGFELVARADDGRVVGVAGWEPLPDGDGELAITVDRSWRGWLGPFLLDSVLRAASARGLRNLQADVLVMNRPMLALARARGFVTMSHPDRGVVRIAMGAGATMPAVTEPGSWSRCPAATGTPKRPHELPTSGSWRARDRRPPGLVGVAAARCCATHRARLPPMPM